MKSASRTAARRADERLDRVFHALANRTRRKLLSRLAGGPAMITDLAEPMDMSFPAVSKHLRVLEAAGLVNRQVDGRVHRCAFDAAPLKEIGAWVDHYRTFWDETLAALARHAEDRDDDR